MKIDTGVISILKATREQSSRKKIDIFLVGGFVRDMLINRVSYDIDLVVSGNSEIFSRALSRRLGANYFLLDKDTQAYRIVYDQSKKARWNIDICKMQGGGINSDLKRRDFTINAMAVDVNKLTSLQVDKSISENLVDLFNGTGDLKKKTIKLVSAKCLDEDPLRMLRAFRLSATLGFKIEHKTAKEIAKRVSKIKKISRERVRDELFKMLECKESHRFLEELCRIKLLEAIVPETKFLDREKGLLKHSILTVKFLEYLLDRKNLAKVWSDSLAKDTIFEISKSTAQISDTALLKFLCLFHDIGKPFTKKKKGNKLTFICHDSVGAEILEKIAIGLRLSNKQTKMLKALTKSHMRAHYLVNLKTITKRAEVRFTRDIGEETPLLLLFTVADFLSTSKELKKLSFKQNRSATKKIISSYFKFKKAKKFTRFINGHDLINKFKMKQGPKIGKVLDELELAQREGKIETRKEGLMFAEKLAKKA